MRIATSAFLLPLMMVAACNGSVITEVVRPSSLSTPGWSTPGVLTYPPSLFIETSEFTVLIDDSGKVSKTRDNTDPKNRCFPVKTAKFVVRPDYSRPHIVRYDAGLLETNKFSLNLSDGMVTSVNSESTPDRGETLKNVVEAVGSIIPLPAAKVKAQATSKTERTAMQTFEPCNAGPVVVGLRRCNDYLQECDQSIE